MRCCEQWYAVFKYRLERSGDDRDRGCSTIRETVRRHGVMRRNDSAHEQRSGGAERCVHGACLGGVRSLLHCTPPSAVFVRAFVAGHSVGRGVQPQAASECTANHRSLLLPLDSPASDTAAPTVTALLAMLLCCWVDHSVPLCHSGRLRCAVWLAALLHLHPRVNSARASGPCRCRCALSRHYPPLVSCSAQRGVRDIVEHTQP